MSQVGRAKGRSLFVGCAPRAAATPSAAVNDSTHSKGTTGVHLICTLYATPLTKTPRNFLPVAPALSGESPDFAPPLCPQ